MEPSGGAISLHSIVYCLDVDLFINRIAALHSKTVNDFRIKFGIDYGQSFLKVTITLTTASRNSSGQIMLLAACQPLEIYTNLKSFFTRLKVP